MQILTEHVKIKLEFYLIFNRVSQLGWFTPPPPPPPQHTHTHTPARYVPGRSQLDKSEKWAYFVSWCVVIGPSFLPRDCSQSTLVWHLSPLLVDFGYLSINFGDLAQSMCCQRLPNLINFHSIISINNTLQLLNRVRCQQNLDILYKMSTALQFDIEALTHLYSIEL